MRSRIEMIEGSWIAGSVAEQVRARASGKKRVLVALDSNHTHAHVLEELRLYAPLVTPGSYCIVFDTIIEDLPADSFPDRPWGRGGNPKTAVWEYLKSHPEFEIDRSIHDKLLVTVAPDGYLKRVHSATRDTQKLQPCCILNVDGAAGESAAPCTNLDLVPQGTVFAAW
jgi:cephalosporin hydroxylase